MRLLSVCTLALLLPVLSQTAVAGVTDEEIPELPGIRDDFPPPSAVEYGRTSIIPFLDAGPVIYLRSVGFSDAPGEAQGTFSPHIYLGSGARPRPALHRPRGYDAGPFCFCSSS